jgi:hypothetical protein
VTEASFVNLQFQDYDNLGITVHHDRQKLFKLIQVVKRELEGKGVPVSAPSPAALSAPGGPPKSKRTPSTGLPAPRSYDDSGENGPPRDPPRPPLTLARDTAGEVDPDDGPSASAASRDRLAQLAKPKNPRKPAAAAAPAAASGPAAAPSMARPQSSSSSGAAALAPRGPPVRQDSRPSPSPPPRAPSPAQDMADDVGAGPAMLPGADVLDADGLPMSKIRVVVRKRPLSKKEASLDEKDIISFAKGENKTVFLHEFKSVPGYTVVQSWQSSHAAPACA